MLTLRRILAVLLVFCLAAAPAVAHAAAAKSVAPSGSLVKMASMPDCPGMKMAGAGQSSPAKKHCPGCDNNAPCSADQCQLKCVKLLGALPSPARTTAKLATRYDRAEYVLPVPVSLAPQPPPPRA